MVSESSKEVQLWHDKYTELDVKFQSYFKKSEAYIGVKEEELTALNEEAKNMTYKYANHEKIFKQEKGRADEYEKLYCDLDQPYK